MDFFTALIVKISLFIAVLSGSATAPPVLIATSTVETVISVPQIAATSTAPFAPEAKAPAEFVAAEDSIVNEIVNQIPVHVTVIIPQEALAPGAPVAAAPVPLNRWCDFNHDVNVQLSRTQSYIVAKNMPKGECRVSEATQTLAEFKAFLEQTGTDARSFLKAKQDFHGTIESCSVTTKVTGIVITVRCYAVE